MARYSFPENPGCPGEAHGALPPSTATIYARAASATTEQQNITLLLDRPETLRTVLAPGLPRQSMDSMSEPAQRQAASQLVGSVVRRGAICLASWVRGSVW